MAKSMAQLSLGPAAAICEKLIDKKYRHFKPLYVKGFINGKPVGGMLIDAGATVNIMPYSLCRKIGRSIKDLVKTNVILNDFKGTSSQVKEVLNVELTVGHKTLNTSFFVVNDHGPYSALLGRDWIHANCCVPSSMHKCLIQWDGDNIEIVPTNDSRSIA